MTPAASVHLGCSVEKGRKAKKERQEQKIVIYSLLMQGEQVTLSGNWLLSVCFYFLNNSGCLSIQMSLFVYSFFFKVFIFEKG